MNQGDKCWFDNAFVTCMTLTLSVARLARAEKSRRSPKHMYLLAYNGQLPQSSDFTTTLAHNDDSE